MTSIKLDTVLQQLVKTAPPGELASVRESLTTLLSSQADVSTVNKAIEKYVFEHPTVFSSKYIACNLNKQKQGTKYVDHVHKKVFNIDFASQTAIDIEDLDEDVEYPEFFTELSNKLQAYGEDHYPSTFAYAIIPDGSKTHVVIIGQRLNSDNYYTGQWLSQYVIENGSVSGNIKLDIHYFEDGNVRLNFEEKVDSISVKGASDIVNGINNGENKATLKIVDQFEQLNQKYFKNLRRLLPVTKSKVNWGRAIGNYRLGSDVVNKK